MIPIYQAQKEDNEWIEGYLSEHRHIVMGVVESVWYEITNEKERYIINHYTLGIHFPNMLDKNKKKIFASLNKDGIGGNTCIDSYNDKYVCIFNEVTNSCVMKYDTIQMETQTMGVYTNYWPTFEITGIKE